LQYMAPALKPDDPTFWDMKKRCVRCTKFYTERENNCCWYHPGKYKTPLHAAEGSLVGWSCCRSIPDESWLQSSSGEAYFHNVNQEALKLEGKGCTHTEKHLEDKAFTASLAQFPVQQTVAPPTTTATTKEEEPEPEPQDEEREGFFIHPVSTNETLVGIALKYKTTTAELRRINRLTTDTQLFGKKNIYIPKKGDIQGPIPSAPLSEEQKMRHAINNVKLKTGCSTEEAKWYLSDHDNDVDKAVAQWKEDNKWEQQKSGEKGSISRSVPSRSQSVPSTTSLSKSFTSSTPISTRNSTGDGNGSPKEGRPSSLLDDFMSYFK